MAYEAGHIPGNIYGAPRPMTEDDIGHAINQFASAAKAVKAAGFTGVALHGASQYLIAQFLSPLSNDRTDRWGGSLENRARFLVEVVGAMRAGVGPAFPISVKLNVFEHEATGFTLDDCVELTKLLNVAGVDLLELQGTFRFNPSSDSVIPTLESNNRPKAELAWREVGILPFIAPVRAVAKMPIMVTGGFRTRAAMAQALELQEVDMVCLGRPLIADPESPRRLLAGQVDELIAPIAVASNLAATPLATLRWNSLQIERLADGLDPDPLMTGDAALEAFAELEGGKVRALLERRHGRPTRVDMAMVKSSISAR
jgi:2,4-dienoyl-CoA reductase-like NADH-dependent reductase (Old Yellow Enzyme family)